MLHTLIPAAGESSRFAAAGYDKSKGLIRLKWKYDRSTDDAADRSMIEHVISSATRLGPIEHSPVTVGVQRKDLEAYSDLLAGRAVVTSIASSTGQADTVRQMLKAAWIKPDDQIMVVNCDNAFDRGVLRDFITVVTNRKVDAGAVVFETMSGEGAGYGFVSAHPYFSRAVERVRISPYALAGAFYFKSAALIEQAWAWAWAEYKRTLASRSLLEPYLSDLFQFTGCNYAHLIERNSLHEWGTPESLQADETVTWIEPPKG